MERAKAKRKQERGKLKKRMVGYSLAAGAALAAGGPAAADIVYSGPLSIDFGATHGAKQVTLEGTSADIWLTGWAQPGVSKLAAAKAVWVTTTQTVTTSYYGYTAVKPFAVPLSESASIGPTGGFTGGGWVHLLYYNTYGQWGAWTQDGQAAYLGLRFGLEGGGHVYGWAKIERVSSGNGRLLGWAYQNDGTPIHVGDAGSAPIPEPSGLGLLALGVAGVLGLRRKRS